MKQAVQALNQVGATQAEAVAALRQVVQNAGKELIQGTLQGSPTTIVLSGVVAPPGALTPAIAIDECGIAKFGTGIGNLVGTAFELSNFVPK